MLLAPLRSVSPKLRCKFYFRKQHLSFHTAWVTSGIADRLDGPLRTRPVYLGKRTKPGKGLSDDRGRRWQTPALLVVDAATNLGPGAPGLPRWTITEDPHTFLEYQTRNPDCVIGIDYQLNGITAADVNGDGRADIVATWSSDNSLVVGD